MIEHVNHVVEKGIQKVNVEISKINHNQLIRQSLSQENLEIPDTSHHVIRIQEL